MPRATQYAGGLSHRLPSGKGVSCRDRGSGRGKIFIEELPESVVRQHLVALEVVRVPGHRVAPRCLPQGGEVGVGNSVQPHIFVVEGRIVDADFRWRDPARHPPRLGDAPHQARDKAPILA